MAAGVGLGDGALHVVPVQLAGVRTQLDVLVVDLKIIDSFRKK